MATVPAQTEAAAQLFGRLATAAAAFELDVTKLADECMVLGTGLERFARVTTDDEFSTLTVTGRRPAQESANRLERSAFLELGMSRGTDEISIVDHRIGPGTVDEDLALIRAGGVPALLEAELEHRLAILCPHGKTVGLTTRFGDDRERSWMVHTRHDHHDAASSAASIQRISRVMDRCGITDLQRKLVENVHGPLCRKGIAVASVGTTLESANSELRLSYQNLSFEVIVRLLGGIYPEGDHAKQLGSFAGAFDADVAASLVIVLGDVEPLHMLFSIEVQG